MEKLRYECDEAGKFYAGSDVAMLCKLYLGNNLLGFFTVDIDLEGSANLDEDHFIDVRPSSDLEHNLHKFHINENKFEDVMNSKFKRIHGIVGVELKHGMGVLDI